MKKNSLFKKNKAYLCKKHQYEPHPSQLHRPLLRGPQIWNAHQCPDTPRSRADQPLHRRTKTPDQILRRSLQRPLEPRPLRSHPRKTKQDFSLLLQNGPTLS